MYLTYTDGFTIELKADGSCEMVADGETNTGTWEESENGEEVILDGSADDELKIYMGDDNQLKMDMAGIVLSFEKQ